MPTTTNLALPYPASTDLVALGYDQIGDLAVAIDGFFTFASYTPTISQGASTNITKTMSYSNWMNMGTWVLWQFLVTLTGTGTAGSGVTITLPANCDRSGLRTVLGTGMIWDNSTTINYSGVWVAASASTIQFISDGTTALGNRWGTFPNIAIATDDLFQGQLVYKKA